MIKCLIIHPQFPGQFSKTVRFLARDGRFDIKGLSLPHSSTQGGQQPRDIDVREIRPEGKTASQRGGLIYRFEESIRLAFGTGRAIEALRRENWTPDLIYCHTGWGPGQFLKEFAPASPSVKYFEWYYDNDSAEAAWTDRDRTIEDRVRTRGLNAAVLQEYATADIRITPTQWQRDQFPPPLRDGLRVVPDGVDVGWFAPNSEARFRLPDGKELKAGDPVITYVARGADSYRGFDVFIRLLGGLQKHKQHFTAVILGDQNSYYGTGAGSPTFFQQTLRDIQLDFSQVYFLGRVPYKTHRRLLQVSSLHVYLSAPFVMSWSALEALSTGCLVLGWDNKPLSEFADFSSALLAPAGNTGDLLHLALEALRYPARFHHHRLKARSLVIDQQRTELSEMAHQTLLRDLGFY